MKEPSIRFGHIGLWFLLLSHAFILWRAAAQGLSMADVTWLYWWGSLLVVLASAWRMKRTWIRHRVTAAWYLFFICLVLWGLWEYLVRRGYAMSRDWDIAVALVWMLLNQGLDLRRHLQFDAKQDPGGLHFIILWFARLVPFMLIAVLPSQFAWLNLGRSSWELLAFLGAIATVDVMMHRAGPWFGRDPTVWQQKGLNKSSNNYLKWYRPSEWKQPKPWDRAGK